MKLNVSKSANSAGIRCFTRIYIGDDAPYGFQYQIFYNNSIREETSIFTQNEHRCYDLYYDNTYSSQPYYTKAYLTRLVGSMTVCTTKE
jgi:hypothetical protein